jgi:hypothetical protein
MAVEISASVAKPEQDEFLWRKSPIRNITLTRDDLERLHKLFQERLDALLEIRKREFEAANPEMDSDKKKELYESAKNNFKVTSIIQRKDGTEIRSTDHSIFSDPKVGEDIEIIVIDTTAKNERINQQKIYPYARLELWLSDPSFLDPTAVLSAGSSNNSNLLLVGVDQEWCEKTYSEFKRIVGGKKNYRDALHAKFVYDFILYVFYIPSLILIALKYNDVLKAMEIKYSIIIIYFSAFCVFFMSMILFRVCFDMLKSAYPTVEIEEYAAKNKWMRWLVGILPLGVIGGAMWGLIKSLFS